MKKILALALALVLALSLGVIAFADDAGIAGGIPRVSADDVSFDWTWDVFETAKKAYCRIGVDFRYEDDILIYVCPNCVGWALLNSPDEDNWDKFNGWDFDDDSFELFSDGPFTATCKEVTVLDDASEETAIYTYQVKFNGAYYDLYTDNVAGFQGDEAYIYAKLGDHKTKAFYLFDLTDYTFDDDDLTFYLDADATAAVPELVTDPDVIADLVKISFEANTGLHHLYEIKVVPVDDYGTKVVRGSLYFKMIDYTSGRTAKFTSAPLYIDFYHTDVYDDDVKDVAGEKKALVLDEGLPYDNEFDCGTHDHEGGYTVDTTWTGLFVDGLYDYDYVYGYFEQTPDVISAEHFDEGVGKTLKITDVDYTWRLEMAKVAEYQPSVNFTFNSTVADVIKGAFPDAKFQAVNFLTPNDGVIYKTASKLYIKCDAKALAQKGEDTVYAYKYVGGVLEYQDAFEVNYYNTGDQYVYVELAAGESLGSYYLSDTDLRAAAPTEENPNTGANDVVGVAVALAVVSLVAAAAVSLKK